MRRKLKPLRRPPAVQVIERAGPRPKNVADMDRVDLENQAKALGMPQRALQLSDDRLRQNIVAFAQELYA